MSNTVVIGSQWGDEGKAKVVDFLTLDADVVVRFQGGANAGHTIINDKGGTVVSQTEDQRGYNIYYATETEGVISRANEADSTTIGAGISARILQGAVIEDLTLSGGKILLSSGAVVRGLTVSEGGYETKDAFKHLPGHSGAFTSQLEQILVDTMKEFIGRKVTLDYLMKKV